MKWTRIGTLAVRKGQRLRINSEYARWFDEIEVPEDTTVELLAVFENGQAAARE